MRAFAIAIAFACVLASATARAGEVKCDQPHVHHAAIYAPRGERPKVAREKLEALAHALAHDGYTAYVQGTSMKTCGDSPCPDDRFWLSLVATDKQLVALVGAHDPHVATKGDYYNHLAALADAPFRALRPFGWMTIHITCEARE